MRKLAHAHNILIPFTLPPLISWSTFPFAKKCITIFILFFTLLTLWFPFMRETMQDLYLCVLLDTVVSSIHFSMNDAHLSFYMAEYRKKNIL